MSTVGTCAYIDTELSFEKDPAELGEPGSLDVNTHQTGEWIFLPDAYGVGCRDFLTFNVCVLR